MGKNESRTTREPNGVRVGGVGGWGTVKEVVGPCGCKLPVHSSVGTFSSQALLACFYLWDSTSTVHLLPYPLQKGVLLHSFPYMPVIEQAQGTFNDFSASNHGLTAQESDGG